jgi:hypothetical protein
MATFVYINAYDNSVNSLVLNSGSSVSGLTSTTSQFADININLSGTNNTLTGLTLTGSDNSTTGFNMWADGYTDTGRTGTYDGNEITVITIPALPL